MHELKIKPKYMDSVLDGTKTFEIRYNGDRGFQKGDTVMLKEWDAYYLERSVMVEITYVTNFEQKPNWVVFGFKLI